MDLFGAFSLLLAAALALAAFFPDRIQDIEVYRKGLIQFLVALALYYPVSGLFWIGVYLSFVARPLGFLLGLNSFRLLCVCLIRRR